MDDCRLEDIRRLETEQLRTMRGPDKKYEKSQTLSEPGPDQFSQLSPWKTTNKETRMDVKM